MSQRTDLFKKFGELASRVDSMKVLIQNNPAEVVIAPTDLARWNKCVYEINLDFQNLTRATKKLVIERNPGLRKSHMCQTCKAPLFKEGDTYSCENPICDTNADSAPAVFNFDNEGGE